MNQELDKYLHSVAHELRSLEQQQREAELREMRGHLEAIVARLMEGGASESEAVEAAIAQFGESRTVGKELGKASEKTEAWWRIVLAPVAGMTCIGALSNVKGPLYDALDKLLLSEPWYMSIASPIFRAFCWATEWPTFLLIGAVTQLISPRWGARLMLGLCTAMLIPPLLTMTSKGDMDFVGFVSGSFLVCFSGIWLGSRWASRLTRKQQNARPSGSSQAA